MHTQPHLDILLVLHGDLRPCRYAVLYALHHHILVPVVRQAGRAVRCMAEGRTGGQLRPIGLVNGVAQRMPPTGAQAQRALKLYAAHAVALFMGLQGPCP